MRPLTRRLVLGAWLLVASACSAPLQAPSTPTLTATPTPAPATATVAPPTPTPLPTFAVPEIGAFPGPVLYEGDRVSFQVPIDTDSGLDVEAAVLTVDGQPSPVEADIDYDPVLNVNVLIFRQAFDTAGGVGGHQVRVEAPAKDGMSLEFSAAFEVRPAFERPFQQETAAWTTATSACCVLRYLSHTAAGRDIDRLAAEVEAAVAEIQAALGVEAEDQLTTVWLDRFWGNGGFANNEQFVVSYVDRNYGPGQGEIGLKLVLRHEAVHLFDSVGRLRSSQTPWGLREGLAVHFAGGHYKPEPIPERAAALAALELDVPLLTLIADFPSLQHESRYLQAAALVGYLIETYGWEAFVGFFATELPEGQDADPGSWFAAALEGAYELSVEQLEMDYSRWVLRHQPGAQIEDLRLTIELQEARRRYQVEWAPYPTIALLLPVDEVDVAVVIREPGQPEHAALETMLANAQAALGAGRFAEAQTLLDAFQRVLDTRAFRDAPESDYLSVAQTVAARGYEAQSIVLDGPTALVRAVRIAPTLETLRLEKTAGTWRIVGVGTG